MTTPYESDNGSQAMDSSRGEGLTGLAHDVVMSVEAWTGAFFTSLLSLTIGVPLIIATATMPVVDSWERQEFSHLYSLFVTGTLLWFWLSAPHLYRTWSNLQRGDRPLAPSDAKRMAPSRWFFRPVICGWHAMFFATGISFAVMFERMQPPGTSADRPIGQAVFTGVFVLFYTFAANGFLLAAVKAATGSDRWVDRVWSCRVLIDLSIVAISFVPWR